MIHQGTGGAVPAPDSGRCETVWCQEPTNDASIQSQISIIPEDVVTQAADFTSETDQAISMAKWWGTVFSGPGPVEHFVITFWRSDGCAGPLGDPIYVREIFSWTEVIMEDETLEYTASFDPVPMDAGESYWLSIQAVMNIDPGGYWGWRCRDVVMCPAMVTAPSFGIFDWTPTYPDIFPDVPNLVDRAFCLYTDGAVSNVTASWGTVKALYR